MAETLQLPAFYAHEQLGTQRVEQPVVPELPRDVNTDSFKPPLAPPNPLEAKVPVDPATGRFMHIPKDPFSQLPNANEAITSGVKLDDFLPIKLLIKREDTGTLDPKGNKIYKDTFGHVLTKKSKGYAAMSEDEFTQKVAADDAWKPGKYNLGQRFAARRTAKAAATQPNVVADTTTAPVDVAVEPTAVAPTTPVTPRLPGLLPPPRPLPPPSIEAAVAPTVPTAEPTPSTAAPPEVAPHPKLVVADSEDDHTTSPDDAERRVLRRMAVGVAIVGAGLVGLLIGNFLPEAKRNTPDVPVEVTTTVPVPTTEAITVTTAPVPTTEKPTTTLPAPATTLPKPTPTTPPTTNDLSGFYGNNG